MVGSLTNGLTYYIKENSYPKNKAYLQLVVKVGSLYEEDNESGVAHFLEHMLFRGTKHFEDWEIIKYLESIGSQFGPDINAYTSFDVTNYILNIPLDKCDSLDNGILILSDFADRATLKDDLINNERSVIIDEYNLTKKNFNGRINAKFIDHFLKGSSYQKRHPIGNKEVILNCDPKIIRNFYKKWYRPDRMAVVAVGNFNAEEVEFLIKKYFECIPKNESEVEYPSTTLDIQGKLDNLIVNESELTVNQGGLCFLEQIFYAKHYTNSSAINCIISNLYNSIMNRRLNNISKINNPPFISCSMCSDELFANIIFDQIEFLFFEDRPLDGLKAAYEELKMFNKFGPTNEELIRAKKELEEIFVDKLENLHNISHSSHASHLIDHFMYGLDYIDREVFLNIQRSLLPIIDVDAIINWSVKHVDINKYNVFYFVAKKNLINNEEIEKLLEDLHSCDIENRVNKQHELQQMEVEKIEDCPMPLITESGSVDYETFSLENGLKVLVHPTDFEKNNVTICLVANGGLTSLPKNYTNSIKMAVEYVFESGLANLDGLNLSEWLSEHNIDCFLSIGSNLRLINICGKNDNMESLCDLIRSIFTLKRFDVSVWENILIKHKEFGKNLNNDPYSYFFKKLNAALHPDHLLFKDVSVKNASKEIAKDVMEMCFSDPSQFTMIIVGDVNKQDVKEIIRTHLNFNISNARKLNDKIDDDYFSPLGSFIKTNYDGVFYKGIDTHPIGVLCYNKQFNSNDKDINYLFASEALANILQTRLLEKLRQNLGDTYNVNVDISYPFAPNLSEIEIYITFSSEPQKINVLKLAIQNEIKNLLELGPTKQEISTTKEIKMQSLKDILHENNTVIRMHELNIFYKYTIKSLAEYAEFINNEITCENVMKLCNHLFKNKNLVTATLLPEEALVN